MKRDTPGRSSEPSTPCRHHPPANPDTTMKRLLTLAALAAVGLTTAAAPSPEHHADKPTITVYKDPDCGCCKNWIEHLIKRGYTVKVNDTRELKKVKRSLGV